jgi:hypothetical protein
MPPFAPGACHMRLRQCCAECLLLGRRGHVCCVPMRYSAGDAAVARAGALGLANCQKGLLHQGGGLCMPAVCVAL